MGAAWICGCDLVKIDNQMPRSLHRAWVLVQFLSEQGSKGLAVLRCPVKQGTWVTEPGFPWTTWQCEPKRLQDWPIMSVAYHCLPALSLLALSGRGVRQSMSLYVLKHTRKTPLRYLRASMQQDQWVIEAASQSLDHLFTKYTLAQSPCAGKLAPNLSDNGHGKDFIPSSKI